MRSLILLVGLMPALAAANECRHTARHDFDVETAGLTTAQFLLESSDIAVEGVPGLAKVEVRGKACASTEQGLAGLGLDQQRNGDRLTVSTRQARNSGNWSGSNYAYLDLKVRVPQALAIAITSSSGDAEVRNVASLAIETSSGDIVADAIAGAVSVQISSGDLQGSALGSVQVQRTSSSDIQVRDVRGDFSIARAGSGDLQLEQVGGNVQLGDVGSGDLSISQVSGDVLIDSIGSGDTSVTDVGGNFTLRAKGSGDVRHRGVRGKVSVPSDD